MLSVTNHEGNGHRNPHEMPWAALAQLPSKANDSADTGVETRDLSHTTAGGCKMDNSLFENHKQVLKSLNSQLPHDPATLLLRKTEQKWKYMCICPCSGMFSGALFIVAKTKGKIPLNTKCPSTAEWVSGAIRLNGMWNVTEQ